MVVIGQSLNSLIITVVHNRSIVWDLGKCRIIRNLNVDMLVGESGKMDNHIVTIPHLKQIGTNDTFGEPMYLNYSDYDGKIRHISRSSNRRTLFAGDSYLFKLPP